MLKTTCVVKFKYMELTRNIVALRYGWIILSEGGRNERLAPVIQMELMRLGYMLDADAYRRVKEADEQQVLRFYTEVMPFLKESMGDGDYRPLYDGFPQQVMSMSEEDLLMNQLVHYWSQGTFIPDSWTEQRAAAFEFPSYRMIKCRTREDFMNIFTDLSGANQSLTSDDKQTLEWFMENEPDCAKWLSAEIPFKETLCMLAAHDMPVKLKTATDVLRFAVYLSGGDVMLPPVPPVQVRANAWTDEMKPNPRRELFRFRSYSHRERKKILQYMEDSTCDAGEMVLKAERWKRLGERLHPGEYRKIYPRAVAAFDSIRHNSARSWYARLNGVTDEKEYLSMLAERPGEFARRLDSLLRNTDTTDIVLSVFMKDVAGKVSGKVLYELYIHFGRRNEPDKIRSIYIKGHRRPVELPVLPPLEKDLTVRVQNIVHDELLNRFSRLPSLGKVYIDEKLRDIPLPSNMRSMSSGLRVAVRGTRIPVTNEQAKVLRFYVHWKDAEGKEDLDLSATFVGKTIEHISWNRSQSTDYAVHSGDVRFRQGDCAEYVDVIIDKARECFRYVIIDVRNYEGRSMQSAHPVFGYMEREYPEANDIWIPSAVKNSFKLSSEESNVIAMAVDLETMEYIILDIDSRSIPVSTQDVSGVTGALRLYMDAPVLSVYDLLSWHVKARGEQVFVQEENVRGFMYDDFVKSYTEILKYMI